MLTLRRRSKLVMPTQVGIHAVAVFNMRKAWMLTSVSMTIRSAPMGQCFRRLVLRRRRIQRLTQISQDVVDMLDPHGQADIARRHTGRGLLGFRQL